MPAKRQKQAAGGPGTVQPPNNPYGIAPELWTKIQNLRLMDDLLMRVALEGNIPAVQLILWIILKKPTLVVTELFVQKDLKLLVSRGLRLDIKAVDADGVRYNIEVQRSDAGAHPKRARYHSAMMDADFLKAGEDTDSLTEMWVIFITENDYFQLGLPVYFIEKCIRNAGNKPFGDEAYIAYVNGAYEGDDEIGHLMADFRTPDPDRMHYKILADSVRAAKSQQKGATKMSRVLEEMRQEGYDKGAEEMEYDHVQTLMKQLNFTLEQAMEFLKVSLTKKPAFEARMQNPAT